MAAGTPPIVMALRIAVAAFVGTGLQMLTSLVEVREVHRPALQVARTEDEIVSAERLWHRRSARRELRSWRDRETEKSLAYVDVVLLAWTLLVLASGAATIQAIIAL